MEILSVCNLVFKVGDAVILNGIDLAVRSGETIGIIGPNGSGKTTLFNCISGFNRAGSGTIRLRQMDITKHEAFERAALGLGRVFQNSGVFRELSILENMLTALENRAGLIANLIPWGRRHAENRKKALQHLAEIGLADRASEKAGSLSGGQMRLLEIARTLALGAEVFLLDEPTAGVSPKMKDEVAAIINKLQELKKSVLIIEHDINFIYRFCERIVVLDQGRVVMDDQPDKVRNNPLLHEIYFGASKH